MRSDHLSPAIVTEVKNLVTANTFASPFKHRDMYVRGIVSRWSRAYYDEKKTAALRKKARRYLRAALSELYPTRMFLRKAKHNLRFSVLKIKNSVI